VKKVIWAVDALSKDKKLQNATLKALLTLTKGTKSTIEPVSVVGPDQLRIPVSVFRQPEKDYRLDTEKNLQKWMASLKRPELVAPTLLVRDVMDELDDADTLLNYARTTGASLIGVGTHVNRGFKRFFIGSFAELLLLKSEIPVLAVNPATPALGKVKRILFPTDFSAGSRKAFEALLETAAGLKAKIVIYHKPDYLIPYTMVTFGAVPDYKAYLETDLKASAEEAGRWAETAKRAGVSAEVAIDRKAGYVDDAILAAAARLKVDLVAMASHSGRVGAALLGSNARKIVRSSRKPVWVIHPAKGAAKLKLASTKF
jgi:nucleotide-binding universal stress UspA family protein